MSEYKSSVLMCNNCETSCPTCEFLNGDRDVRVLLEVIANLDKMLAKQERLADSLTNELSDLRSVDSLRPLKSAELGKRFLDCEVDDG